jgi:4-hydroxy-tetrahydrodipicolinate reductase
MKAPERLEWCWYGLGQIGLETAVVLSRRDIELVGAIDVDPATLNRDVADLSGLSRPSGIRVSDRATEILQVTRPHVAILTTSSRFKDVLPQIKQCVDARTHVVSSCEELLLPHVRYAAQAKDLDRHAKGVGIAVLGTGVNPGFVMDTMALAATAPCLEVKSVAVERVVNASTRRPNLQQKVGAGMTPARFRKGVKGSELGHVGLLESTHLVAEGLGWNLERVDESIKPVLATTRVKTPHVTVQAGQVAGIHHVCRPSTEKARPRPQNVGAKAFRPHHRQRKAGHHAPLRERSRRGRGDHRDARRRGAVHAEARARPAHDGGLSGAPLPNGYVGSLLWRP